MVTTNWILINAAGFENIHFNVKKLESVIGYDKDDKNSLAIWEHLNSDDFEAKTDLFPEKLFNFLELNKYLLSEVVVQDANEEEDFPF